MELKINIVKKHPTIEGAPVIVCGNSGYTVRFTFDEEWDGLEVKTARFVYVQNGTVRYQDIVFSGATVSVPVMSNTKVVLIGVYAGNLRTSAPARVPCVKSIRCGTGAPADPTPSQYDQIMELLNAGGGGGGEGTPNAVQFVPQELTEEQQAQARENIGADANGTAASAVSEHNTNDKAHNDIRLLIEGLATRLSGIADSDDTTLDQLSEIVAYIKSNKSLIDSITTSKVNVSDIIDNLTSNVSNKPLSAAQGVALKALIDKLTTDKLDSSALEGAINIALEKAKESGEFDGEDGKTPVKGVDYYTEADKAEFSEYIAGELAKRGQLAPEYAESLEWLNENGDQSKMYVLSDGMIYAWMLTEKEVEGGAGYTNRLPLATDTDRSTIYGGDYNGDGINDGYQTATRLSSSGNTATSTSNADCGASGFISAKAGDVVRVKNLEPISNVSCYVISYDSSNAKVNNQTFVILSSTTGYFQPNNWLTAVDVENRYIEITLDSGYFGTDFDAIRFSGLISNNTIVTVNEEIKEGGTEIVTEYAWASTGLAFVPADYEERIIAVEDRAFSNTKKIAELEKAVENGGADDATEKDAYNRIKNWKYPIHEDAPVFLLETDKPAIPSTDWNTSAVYAKYDALMNANPHYITRVNCGMASDGTTPIYVYHFKEPEPHYNGTWSETKAVILVVSGVHPTEQSGVWSMYYALEEITNNTKLLDLRRNLHIIVMPMINPTGFTDSTYGVRNPDGIQVHYNFEVDFKYPTDSGYVAHGNRNHGGETPLSIPETQYFDAIMNEYKDTLACVLSCHNNDVDTQWGTGFVWSSCATHFMCNLGFRLVDKLSAAWREKHGAAFDEGVRWANNYALTKKAEGSSTFPNAKEQAEWDFRIGRASISGSGGTEYKQALKYGVHGINVEVCDRCMVIDKDYTKTRTSAVTTMGAETYINFFRTFMAVYDPKDKKDYAPNLPWEE